MHNNFLGFGQYAYPFSFVLPHCMPGSFEYYDDDVSAFIEYKVKARAISWVSKSHDLCNSNLLIVRQTPKEFQYPTNLSDTTHISTWCFFSNGASTLNISYPKNSFSPDESVQVVCNLNNTNCKLDAKCIKLQLFQQMTLKVRGALTKFLTRCISESRFDGTYTGGQDNTRTLEIQMSDVLNPTLRHLDKCPHKHLFRDPNQVSKLQATVKSQLVECKYFLRATTEFDSCVCCGGTPTIDIPVIIYVPEVNVNSMNFRPQNWSPQVMPMYTFTLPSAQQLGFQDVGMVNANVNMGSNQNMNQNPNMNQNQNMNQNHNNNQNQNQNNNQNQNQNNNQNQNQHSNNNVTNHNENYNQNVEHNNNNNFNGNNNNNNQSGPLITGSEPMMTNGTNAQLTQPLISGGNQPMMTGGVEPYQNY